MGSYHRTYKPASFLASEIDSNPIFGTNEICEEEIGIGISW